MNLTKLHWNKCTSKCIALSRAARPMKIVKKDVLTFKNVCNRRLDSIYLYSHSGSLSESIEPFMSDCWNVRITDKHTKLSLI